MESVLMWKFIYLDSLTTNFVFFDVETCMFISPPGCTNALPHSSPIQSHPIEHQMVKIRTCNNCGSRVAGITMVHLTRLPGTLPSALAFRYLTQYHLPYKCSVFVIRFVCACSLSPSRFLLRCR